MNNFFVLDTNVLLHNSEAIASFFYNTVLLPVTVIEEMDNPYLNASSNGLSYTVKRLKGRELCGHIILSKSECRHLSELAADYL